MAGLDRVESWPLDKNADGGFGDNEGASMYGDDGLLGEYYDQDTGRDVSLYPLISEVPLRPEPAKVPQWRMATLASWQFGFAALGAFVMPVLLPLQTVAIVGEADKGTAMGLALAVATIIATLVALALGQVSDRVSTRFGRRSPFILVSALFLSASVTGMSW